MATYNTPGVYVEEVSNLAPSVVQVATAVPAFIGYTQTGFTGPGPAIARINTLLDYTNLFGQANPSAFSVDGNLNVTRSDAATNNFLMYYAVQMYFLNGGSTCYIISIGGYKTTTTSPGGTSTTTATVPAKADFEAGLSLLAKQDEPTLVILPDAVNLSLEDYYALAQDTLSLCANLADRFAILDVLSSSNTWPAQDITNFRNNIGINNLCYGAAYYPYLLTSLNYQYLETGVQVTSGSSWSSDANGITVSQSTNTPANVLITLGTVTSTAFDTTSTPGTLKINLPAASTTASAVATAWSTWTGASNNFNVTANGDGSTVLSAVASTALQTVTPSLDAIKSTNSSLYNQVKVLLAAENVTMPPSSSLAGVYVAVDGGRGVWKAPANVSLASVVAPVVQISNTDQGDLNVDPTGGKSINAIRAFTGQGTLVWGARTLAGNDNDWRYISVRRLFITIEESCQKASSFAVFESNDAVTWLKVQSMIESYLYGLWEQGALAGTDQNSAYFVNVGLGKTMTAQDVLEGRMIVEVGAAPVRPAEFIILRFTQLIQQS